VEEVNESSSESDDEQEQDEIQADQDPTAIVEVSPKGRFNRFNEELGRGAYKIVYKAADTETGREVAWNVVNLRRLSKQDRIRIKSEIDLIKKLQH
jgi:WNK lysine deficient protein kinase